MSWKAVLLDNGERHVIPLDDLVPHQTVDCWCKPFDDDGVWVHNSMDRREVYERAKTSD